MSKIYEKMQQTEMRSDHFYKMNQRIKEAVQAAPQRKDLEIFGQAIWDEAVEFGAYLMLDEMQKGGEFKIDRFNMIGNKRPDGSHVFYEDHIAALQSANAKIAKLTEALRSMHIDGCGWNLDKMTDSESVEMLIGWHKSNNEKIEQALKSCEQYDEKKLENL